MHWEPHAIDCYLVFLCNHYPIRIAQWHETLSSTICIALQHMIDSVRITLLKVEKSSYVEGILHIRRCGCCGAFSHELVQQWKMWSFWSWRFYNLGHIWVTYSPHFPIWLVVLQSGNDICYIDCYYPLKRSRRLLISGTVSYGNYWCYWWTSW